MGDPGLADRFVARAEATFKKLARKHLIFYRLLPDERVVEVVRLVHGARDLDALLGK